MKKLILIIALCVCSIARAEFETITLAVGTNNLAASSTNTTAGAAQALPISGLSGCRIYVSSVGLAGTTNGSETIFLQTAIASTGPWDSATNSNIKVVVPCYGATTNSQSAWFNLTGVQWIRVGQMQNSSVGQCSNTVVTIVTSQPVSHR